MPVLGSFFFSAGFTLPHELALVYPFILRFGGFFSCTQYPNRQMSFCEVEMTHQSFNAVFLIFAYLITCITFY